MSSLYEKCLCCNGTTRGTLFCSISCGRASLDNSTLSKDDTHTTSKSTSDETIPNSPEPSVFEFEDGHEQQIPVMNVQAPSVKRTRGRAHDDSKGSQHS
ncbi:hypothetical protein BDV23DRAFT_166988 [Aspergillus alliaceus]|uniref:Uncharacterized protein n=1 Tax=Petromyces alliaceus TaxID=209559 RepID=A0A5N7BRA0_PETAA|nr:hypothetical protein BDV23DRAFT_166988 [Aspergillus alliaceus]